MYEEHAPSQDELHIVFVLLWYIPGNSYVEPIVHVMKSYYRIVTHYYLIKGCAYVLMNIVVHIIFSVQ